MDAIREFMRQKPWIGWALAFALLATTAWVYVGGGRTNPYSADYLTETVTVKFADTGDEITMSRGEIELELRARAGRLEPGAGILNPKTGKPSGFPFYAQEWNQTISRINAEKAAMASKHGGKLGAPTVLPSKDVTPPEGIGQPVEGAPAAPSAPAAPTAPAAK